MSDQNLPAIQEKQIAATQMVEKYRSEKALVFVNDEDLKTHALFIPEISLLKATREDFHSISGKLMPKSHIVDRIGEASGVSFVAAECSTRSEGGTIYVGRAQGKKRMPDGAWRLSQVHEYEFDVETRAELDFLTDKRGQYNSDTARRKHTLELKKFARQRAGTGARLKVIRELVGMPTGLSPQEMQGGKMVFARVALNTNKMLEDPEMRQAVISHALVATEEIFGPERNVTPAAESLPAPEEQAQAEPGPATEQNQLAGIPGDFDIPWGEEESPVEQIRSWFEMRIHESLAQKTKDWIRSLLDGESGQDLEVLTNYKAKLEEKMAASKSGVENETD